KETKFNPTFDINRYASTEYSNLINDYKIGIVHDENAYAIGGISGHAGLFSSMSDIGKFVQMIRSEGVFTQREILSKAVIDVSRKNYTSYANSYRGLGWELYRDNSMIGDYFSELSYGHTGFTGTSIWIDPNVDVAIILLTNRVHLGRKNHIKSF